MRPLAVSDAVLQAGWMGPVVLGTIKPQNNDAMTLKEMRVVVWPACKKVLVALQQVAWEQ